MTLRLRIWAWALIVGFVTLPVFAAKLLQLETLHFEVPDGFNEPSIARYPGHEHCVFRRFSEGDKRFLAEVTISLTLLDNIRIGDTNLVTIVLTEGPQKVLPLIANQSISDTSKNSSAFKFSAPETVKFGELSAQSVSYIFNGKQGPYHGKRMFFIHKGWSYEIDWLSLDNAPTNVKEGLESMLKGMRVDE